MTCSNCGNEGDDGRRYCRRCGTDLEETLVSKTSLPQKQYPSGTLAPSRTKDPDELIGNGIGSVIMGDGFLMVAVILGATHTAVSSLLWLLLLIPAFLFFGKGFADVLLARQIRRRSQPSLDNVSAPAELSPPRTSIADLFEEHASGELADSARVTERTTRRLNQARF